MTQAVQHVVRRCHQIGHAHQSQHVQMRIALHGGGQGVVHARVAVALAVVPAGLRIEHLIGQVLLIVQVFAEVGIHGHGRDAADHVHERFDLRLLLGF